MLLVDLDALLKRLSPYCTRALEAAAGLCMSRGNYEVMIEHLLLVLLDDPEHDLQRILRHYDIAVSRARRALQHAIEEAKVGNARRPVFASLLVEWLQDAWLLASVEYRLTAIRSGALLVALVINARRYSSATLTKEFSPIPREALRRDLLSITAGSREDTPIQAAEGATLAEGPRDDSALGRFTINFTGKARAGEIDPVFCRDREMRQMIDILGRRRKNNPIAVGDAGVGKTAVVEGLALKIAQGDVPSVLQNVEIYGLDLGLLQAGASVRGEFENRLKAVIAEVKASPTPIILFIDEAHMLIGAGAGDAANLLKPALARGELRTIAATTWSEYKKYFEKDAALARRFQLVKLDEPSVDDTVVIMRGLREMYEMAHGVYIRDDAIVAAASLAARYLSGRQLPDKAVDLLDTTSARVKIALSARPDAIDDCEKHIQMLERELQAIRRDLETGSSGEPERILELRATIRTLQEELQRLDTCWQRERATVTHILALRRQLAAAYVAPPEDSANESLPAASIAAEQGADTPLCQATTTPASPTYNGDIAALRQELEGARAELATLQGDKPLLAFEVTPEAIGKVVADWTGIPVGNMVKDEAQTILQFHNNLQQRIKGQDHAIATVERSIKAARAGLGNPHTPIAVLLFVGPSGVGKTECALGIAELLFGGERFITTINMSEFQEKHTVSRLIGAPPGYVGYGEGGVLTEAVRQRPYSVVLLDEVEKADPEVMNLFYQVFDKGMLADGEGRVIDFKHTVICMTSNLGAEIITEMCSGGPRPEPEALSHAIRPLLNTRFKPALVARMDVVPFYPLAAEALHSIVKLKLGQLATRLRSSQKMQLTYESQVVAQIVARCTEVETGARNIDHIMRGTLLPEISTAMLQTLGSATPAHTLAIDVAPEGHFTYQFLP